VRPAKNGSYRVLLVDGHGLLYARTRPLFESGELIPASHGADYLGALPAVLQAQPDILVVDLGHPDSLGAVESVMAERPTPILGLYDARQFGSLVDPFRALALGALDVAVLPESPAGWAELCRKLTLLAQVRVVQHVQGKLRKRGRTLPGIQAIGPPQPPFPLVAVAASLGGPKALSQILHMIPRGFPAPIVVCQHISTGFTEGLSQWLAAETALDVTEARDGDRMKPGTVFIAPSGAHLLVQADARLKLDPGAPINGFRPSCDALLFSVAESFGRRALGVILTGMGRDGARGLKEIRARGGRTIAQDERTCVVFGMPGEAVSLGAAEEVLPLDEIAGCLMKLVNQC
jgi:two-component system chemotaxis response regulator CheB